MKAILLMVAMAFALVACGPETAPQQQAYQSLPAAQVGQQPAQAPVIVQSAPQHSGMQDMLTGAALGALATHALSGRSKSAPPAAAPVVVNNTHTRVVERTVIVKQAPAAPPPATPKPTAPKPAAIVPPAAPRPTATAYTPPRTSYAPSSVVTPTYRSSPTPSRR